MRVWPDKEVIMQESVVSIRDLSFRYREGEDLVLKDISFDLYQGEWLAVIGPNGSGKSTLAKMINGLLQAATGQLAVMGQLLTDETVWQIRQQVGMVFQNPDNQFVGATVEDDVAFGLENAGIPYEEMKARVHQALADVGMSDYLRHEPARLSGGQKQRVALASVIAQRPNIIILDEASSMLDPLGRQEVMAAIDKLKATYDLTVVSITHDIDEAARANRVLVLKDGQIVQTDTPEHIFSQGEDLINLGLDLPFSQRLKARIEDRGLDLPDHYLDEEALFEWLTTSYLTE